MQRFYIKLSCSKNASKFIVQINQNIRRDFYFTQNSDINIAFLSALSVACEP